MSQKSTAKRRFPRITSVNALLVRKRGTGSLEGFARTQVLGLGGCMFTSDQPVGVGASLDLLISVRGRVARTAGRVVYELPKGSRQIEVGVEFISISPHDREVIRTLFPEPQIKG